MGSWRSLYRKGEDKCVAGVAGLIDCELPTMVGTLCSFSAWTGGAASSGRPIKCQAALKLRHDPGRTAGGDAPAARVFGAAPAYSNIVSFSNSMNF